MMAPSLSLTGIRILAAWVVLANLVFSVMGEVVPFMNPGFFFSYSTLPVTQQCETITLTWGREGATGPNPVAPYFFQIFTSSFIVPFTVEAGDGGDAGSDGKLSFDFTVPFAPGTQYQICMYDSLGTPGGCQMLYTMIANSTVANPTCQNVTFPAESKNLGIDGQVPGGPLSQNGFINQCDDVSIKPLNGTPPFILTISPPNHPPYNITSNTMDPIVWTVSLSRAFPFFMSLVSSEGLVWANGPMGVGASDVDSCLATDTMLKTKAHGIAAGAAIGGIFGGIFLVGVGYLAKRYWRHQKKHIITPWIDDSRRGTDSSSDGSITSNDKPRLDPLTVNNIGRGYPFSTSQPQPTPVSTIYPQHSASQLFVRHQDGGRMFSRSPLEVTQEVVELPPDYIGRSPDSEGPTEMQMQMRERRVPRRQDQDRRR
ncbi:hypothetical protein BT96DRAFT_1024373 [Gymnopus androsaceus JB14]|uniref:Mid2 domain-containing protein n=1 Tax=Gymnopus androsaceus JB14 TaxID=1447944 RepID=A0A6A4GYB7_9AGAR|nr:hypothetical protein BT96DRAFT_1024373 [Gymnopus androsaceus JB14]